MKYKLFIKKFGFCMDFASVILYNRIREARERSQRERKLKNAAFRRNSIR